MQQLIHHPRGTPSEHRFKLNKHPPVHVGMTSTAGETSRRPSIFSLEDQFTFYISYHSNKVNKAIHFACIWPILWTTLALMTQLPIGKLPPGILEWLPLRNDAWGLHVGSPILLIYVVVYCVMDPFAGGLASLLMVASYFTANLWIADGGSLALAGGVNFACWIAQFYGHYVHEGRSPAIMDNLFQAFLAAPLFVLCEVLFELGYRPNLHKRIKARAHLNIGAFRAAKMFKDAGKTN